MTAFRKISKNQVRRNYNKKDGQRRPEGTFMDWEGNGFELEKPPSVWLYTKYSVTFRVAPGSIGPKSGLVARCGVIAKIWPFGTDPAIIAKGLDDLALQISLGQLTIYGEIDEIDIDAYMSDLPQAPAPAMWVSSPTI